MLADVEQDEVLGDTAAIEFRGHLMRLQRQMIALLPKFSLNEKTFKQVGAPLRSIALLHSIICAIRKYFGLLSGFSVCQALCYDVLQIRQLETPGGDVDAQETRLQIRVSFIEVSCNVVAFCRTLITKSGDATPSFLQCCQLFTSPACWC